MDINITDYLREQAIDLDCEFIVSLCIRTGVYISSFDLDSLDEKTDKFSCLKQIDPNYVFLSEQDTKTLRAWISMLGWTGGSSLIPRISLKFLENYHPPEIVHSKDDLEALKESIRCNLPLAAQFASSTGSERFSENVEKGLG